MDGLYRDGGPGRDDVRSPEEVSRFVESFRVLLQVQEPSFKRVEISKDVVVIVGGGRSHRLSEDVSEADVISDFMTFAKISDFLTCQWQVITFVCL